MSEFCDFQDSVSVNKIYLQSVYQGEGGMWVPEPQGTALIVWMSSLIRSQHGKNDEDELEVGAGVAIEPLCSSSQYGLFIHPFVLLKNQEQYSSLSKLSMSSFI